MKTIHVKRIYEPPEASDGIRILVDRLWPRGLSREASRIDDWLKDVAPTDPLRRWFAHDVRKWPQFRSRYLAELKDNPAADRLKQMALKAAVITLLYAARDEMHNNAIVLRQFLENGGSEDEP